MGGRPSERHGVPRTIRTIGTFTATARGRRLVVRPSVARLLAVLAVRGPLTRPDASGALWPDLSHRRALANLRTALWRARVDAPGFVRDDGDVVALDDVQVDLAALREWAWEALREGQHLRDAPDVHSDDLLPGWSDEWLVQPREELRLLRLYALEASSKRLLQAGRLGEAASHALAAVGIDPLRESANRMLIEVHLSGENRSAALRQYRRYAQLLRGEMQTEPGPGLTALVSPLTAARRG